MCDQRGGLWGGDGQELLSEDVRRGRLPHHADITEEEEPDEDEEMGSDESVPGVRHGRPHVQSEPEGTTILEGSVVERSSRPLIVPETEEPRQHRHGELDRKGTFSEILGRPGS